MKEKVRLFICNIRIKCEIYYLRLFKYIDKNFEPLKCTCGNKELEGCNCDYLDGRNIVLEFDCRCKKCGKILNHWAYGNWQIWK